MLGNGDDVRWWLSQLLHVRPRNRNVGKLIALAKMCIPVFKVKAMAWTIELSAGATTSVTSKFVSLLSGKTHTNYTVINRHNSKLTAGVVQTCSKMKIDYKETRLEYTHLLRHLQYFFASHVLVSLHSGLYSFSITPLYCHPPHFLAKHFKIKS